MKSFILNTSSIATSFQFQRQGHKIPCPEQPMWSKIQNLHKVLLVRILKADNKGETGPNIK
jgi:hypothetical protein